MYKVVGSAFVLIVLLQAAQQFTAVQPQLFASGASFTNAWADIDADGDLDLFVGFNGEPNRMYRNDAGVFVDVASQFGVADARATRSAAWGDFDSDGDSDLLVGFTPSPTASLLRLYQRTSNGFADVTGAVGLTVMTGAVRQVSWIDFDGDHDLDLFVAFRDRANALFRNDGGRFSDVAAEVGLADARKTVGAVWLDYDEDGDLDLYVGNMDGDANGLFRNDRGRFSDVAGAAGVEWGGREPGAAINGTVRPCVADVDGDGRLDIFAANYGRNGLFLNRGNGSFEDVSAQWGVAIDARYDACAFSDFDNDGRLDLYVNGTVTGGTSYRDYLFRNSGSGYVDVTPDNLLALHADHGVQWGDFDGDGAEDLALTGSRADGMHYVMRNVLPPAVAARSLHVRVLDARGMSVLAGAEVRVYRAGTRDAIGTRLLDTGSGYNAQNDMPVHFGLGSASAVDVEVIFPGGVRRVGARATNVRTADYNGRALVLRLN
jgi:hypothetical protein